MLRAIPKGWFSWDFTVVDEESGPVAEIDVSTWREKGLLTVDGVGYEVFREGLMSGAFLLKQGDSLLARAEKPSAFRRTFLIDYSDRHYTLQARSFWRRELVLLDGSLEVGSLAPEGAFSRRMRVDLPEELPLPVEVFLVWLAVILWKRASEAAATTAAAGAS